MILRLLASKGRPKRYSTLYCVLCKELYEQQKTPEVKGFPIRSRQKVRKVVHT
jgi:hypothetical protein